MKQRSTSMAKAMREAEPVRAQFRKDFPCCMYCGRFGGDIHEISRGGSREKSLGERCALLRLCRHCHERIHKDWTVEQQYALKALRDPDGFDRVRLNLLRNRWEDAISESDVWRAAPEVLSRVMSWSNI